MYYRMLTHDVGINVYIDVIKNDPCPNSDAWLTNLC